MKTGLVLEGGGLRGIFTEGVVDCLLDHEIIFDYVIGVSAGACNLFAYVGEQKRYIRKCLIQKNPFDSFYGIPQMVGSHRLVDLDKIFEEYSITYGFMENEYVISFCEFYKETTEVRDFDSLLNVSRDGATVKEMIESVDEKDIDIF